MLPLYFLQHLTFQNNLKGKNILNEQRHLGNWIHWEWECFKCFSNVEIFLVAQGALMSQETSHRSEGAFSQGSHGRGIHSLWIPSIVNGLWIIPHNSILKKTFTSTLVAVQVPGLQLHILCSQLRVVYHYLQIILRISFIVHWF